VGPRIALAFIRCDAGLDVVIDDANHLAAHIVRSERLQHFAQQLLRGGRLIVRFQGAVEGNRFEGHGARFG